jgi:hypothetical protein
VKNLKSCFRPGCWLALLGLFPGVALADGGQSDITLSLGYRFDSLDWNIADNASGPNILSELEWRDMDILQLKADLVTTNRTGYVFRGSVDYGWVRGGENQDSDYNGDNRTLEFSRSVNAVDGSRVYDLSGGLGFTLFAGEAEQYRITPILGYSYHRQDLRMTDGFQIIPASGPFPGLNSSYDAEWSGPWVGADFKTNLQGGETLFARLEHHWADYYGKANWNLRTVAIDPVSALQHPVSFEHWADGRGWVLELGWHNPSTLYSWNWGVSLLFQRWETDAGLDRVYGANPAPPCFGNCYIETRLNEVNWSSRSINVTLQKAFPR